jgi:hypothetical protein
MLRDVKILSSFFFSLLLLVSCSKNSGSGGGGGDIKQFLANSQWVGVLSQNGYQYAPPASKFFFRKYTLEWPHHDWCWSHTGITGLSRSECNWFWQKLCLLYAQRHNSARATYAADTHARRIENCMQTGWRSSIYVWL